MGGKEKVVSGVCDGGASSSVVSDKEMSRRDGVRRDVQHLFVQPLCVYEPKSVEISVDLVSD